MFEARTQEEILKELQAWSTSQQSNFEGTFEYDVLSSNAIEFAKVEVELEQAYKAAFADTSWGEYLTMLAGAVGVIRRTATKAVGTVTVSGRGTIPAGALFGTQEGLRFEADEETVVIDSAEIAVTATKAGEVGNVQAETVNLIPLSIPGITGVINNEAMHDGYDEEDDATLLYRYLFKVRMPATSGNPYHYIQWAMEVPGVGAAKCQRTWAGPNTVRVIIADSDLNPASETLIQEVYNHIEEERPIGVKLTVSSAVPVDIDIEARIVGIVDEDAFIAAVKSYFKDITSQIMTTVSPQAIQDYYVSVAHIGKCLVLNGHVEDYDTNSLFLNGKEANVQLGIDELPRLGAVNLYV